MSSAPEAAAAIPAVMSTDVGYTRAWNFQSDTAQITALGVALAGDILRRSTIFACDKSLRK
jgi:hypothetical protein